MVELIIFLCALAPLREKTLFAESKPQIPKKNGGIPHFDGLKIIIQAGTS